MKRPEGNQLIGMRAMGIDRDIHRSRDSLYLNGGGIGAHISHPQC